MKQKSVSGMILLKNNHVPQFVKFMILSTSRTLFVEACDNILRIMTEQ